MTEQTNAPSKPHTLAIQIDRTEYHVPAGILTGAQLRQMPHRPIPEDRDLYLEVHGHDDDQLITDTTTVDLKDGMRFFTTPKTITPGK